MSKLRSAELLRCPPELAAASRPNGSSLSSHRAYVLGDDIGLIDWQHCAKWDELVVRRGTAEPDRHVYLLLDCSRSMAFGESGKFVLARQITADVAWSVLRRMDRLHVLTFADGIAAELPPLRGQQSVRVVRFLQAAWPRGTQTDLAKTVQAFCARYQRPGPTIIVSDFLGSGRVRGALDMLREHRYEPRLIQLIDPREADPAMIGDCELQDMETGVCWQGRITKKIRARYRLLFASYLESLRTSCLAARIPYVLLDTDAPRKHVLQKVTSILTEKRAYCLL